MRPVTLELKGFSVFRDETLIDFTDVDLFALVGKTGSGKSTVIDGITFALYGAVARYGDNRLVAPAINQTSTEARVRLVFELDGSEYTAVRVVRRTKTGATTKEARLERGDEVIADDARSLTDAVEGLLGLDADQFNRTVVLPQGRFADFLHADPRDRQSTLRRLLGLDVYERVGKAARALATRRSDQVKLLEDDLDDDLDLSDERRDELEAKQRRVGEVRTALNGLRDELAEIDRRRPALNERVETARATFRLLSALQRPDGIDDLVERLDTATQLLADAATALDQANAATAAADAAVQSGPDVAALTAYQSSHAQLASTNERLEAATSELAHAADDLHAASVIVGTVRDEQRRLDEAAAQAQTQLNAALGAAADAPGQDQIELWTNAYAERRTLDDDLAAARSRHDELIAAEQAARSVLDSASDERQAAEEAVGAAERRHGIVAYADALHVGEPCPLCLQTVDTLPDHGVDSELSDARSRLDAARAAESAARSAHTETERELTANRLTTDTLADQIAKLDQRLGGYPAEGALAGLSAGLAELTARVESSRAEHGAAIDAANRHRDDSTNAAAIARFESLTAAVAGLNSQIATLSETAAGLTNSLADAPAAAECARLLSVASELNATHREAVDRERELRSAHKQQQDKVDAVTRQRDAAVDRLTDARESVVHLKAPRLDGTSLGDDWSTLLNWAADELAEVRSIGEAARAELDALDADKATTRDEVAALCSGVGYALGTDRPIEDATNAIDQAVSDARDALRRFDDERKRRVEVIAKIDKLKADQAVAAKLGHLMRSDGFERWFMQTALADLAERATDRLMELSGGLYSLVLNDRAFEVCDHANADELRSARTLSGGETFLASLALALALAEATADLSPENVPRIDSIFLDEGFGTLDPDTLDVVSAAIEELGASGRMVGIITHIRELADRMPVRFEVSKLAASSTVTRVEV